MDILLSVSGPTMAEPGCTRCETAVGTSENTILHIEEWKSDRDLARHIRSDLYLRILAAMEYSADHPEISFFEIRDTKGFEMIERIRKYPGE